MVNFATLSGSLPFIGTLLLRSWRQTVPLAASQKIAFLKINGGFYDYQQQQLSF
jgi:hypothetical protein